MRTPSPELFFQGPQIEYDAAFRTFLKDALLDCIGYHVNLGTIFKIEIINILTKALHDERTNLKGNPRSAALHQYVRLLSNMNVSSVTDLFSKTTRVVTEGCDRFQTYDPHNLEFHRAFSNWVNNQFGEAPDTSRKLHIGFQNITTQLLTTEVASLSLNASPNVAGTAASAGPRW